MSTNRSNWSVIRDAGSMVRRSQPKVNYWNVEPFRNSYDITKPRLLKSPDFGIWICTPNHCFETTDSHRFRSFVKQCFKSGHHYCTARLWNKYDSYVCWCIPKHNTCNASLALTLYISSSYSKKTVMVGCFSSQIGGISSLQRHHRREKYGITCSERLFMIYSDYKTISGWIVTIISCLFSHTVATQLCWNAL